jgi:hypothetical protein
MDNSIPQKNVQAALREWQHISYEIVFPPHRVMNSFTQIALSLSKLEVLSWNGFKNTPPQAQTTTLASDTKNDRSLFQMYCRNAPKPLPARKHRYSQKHKHLTKVIAQSQDDVHLISAYYRAAMRAIRFFGHTLHDEAGLLTNYINYRKRLLSENVCLRYSVTIADDLSEEPFLILPTMLLHPWCCLLLRAAGGKKAMAIDITFKEHPETADTLQCTFRTENIPFIRFGDRVEKDERTTWSMIQERNALCEMLSLPQSAVIEGDVFETQGEYRQAQEDRGEFKPCVEITLTIPIITAHHQQRLALSPESIFLPPIFG